MTSPELSASPHSRSRRWTVDLVDDDEAVRVNADGVGDASAILQDVRGLITDVVAEVQ